MVGWLTLLTFVCGGGGPTSSRWVRFSLGSLKSLAKATTRRTDVCEIVVKRVSVNRGIDFDFARLPSANDDISSKQLIVLTIKDYDVRRSDFRFGRDYDLLLALDGHIGDVRVTDNNVADRPRQF